MSSAVSLPIFFALTFNAVFLIKYSAISYCLSLTARCKMLLPYRS
uniref:Uncharacterized protein n=1 Tax=Rhizophora mucronata TaxID=61149 RepID=A0A2P2IRI7_RHIMU